MKTIKWIVLLVYFGLSFSLTAQLEVGGKVSLIPTDIAISKVDNQNIKSISVDNGIGFRVGVFVRINIIKLYIQPELLFTQLNAKITSQNQLGNVHTEAFLLNRLDVPFPFGVKLGQFRVFTGPVASFNLNAGSPMFNNTFKQGTWGLQGGVTYVLKKFEFTLHYEGGMTEYATEAEVNIGEEVYDVPLNIKNSTFGFSLSYTF